MGGLNNRNTCPYNAVQFNSASDYSLQKDQKFESTPFLKVSTQAQHSNDQEGGLIA